MRTFIHIIFIMATACMFVFGGDGGRDRMFLMMRTDSTANTSANGDNADKSIFGGRKGTAAIYSLIMPGSGQTMLGSPYKGFTFTFVAFGSALTTLISHNNFVASNERMDALEFQYKSSTTWETSDLLYTHMKETHTKLVRYKNMRNTFAVISAIVWSLNIADVLFNTEDEGEIIFSSISITTAPTLIAAGVVDQQQRINFSIPLD